MTDRRYGFRFSAVGAGTLILGVLLASFLVFLSGIYVGKGVATRRSVEQVATARIPAPVSNEIQTSSSNTSLPWQLPKDKQSEAKPLVAAQEEKARQQPRAETLLMATTEENTTRAKDQKKGEREAAAAFSEERRGQVREKLHSQKEERLERTAKEYQKPQKIDSAPGTTKTRLSDEGTRVLAARTAPIQPQALEQEDFKKSLPSSLQKETGGQKRWRVQVEATSREEVAQEIARALRAQGYVPSVSKVTKGDGVLYRIRVGKFATQEDAVAAIGRFRREGKFSQAYPVSE